MTQEEFDNNLLRLNLMSETTKSLLIYVCWHAHHQLLAKFLSKLAAMPDGIRKRAVAPRSDWTGGRAQSAGRFSVGRSPLNEVRQ